VTDRLIRSVAGSPPSGKIWYQSSAFKPIRPRLSEPDAAGYLWDAEHQLGRTVRH
jgi:hypothetical protein